jgi:hypothetical protein
MYHDRCIPLFFEKMSSACTVATDVKCHVRWQIKGATSRYPMSLELSLTIFTLSYTTMRKNSMTRSNGLENFILFFFIMIV